METFKNIIEVLLALAVCVVCGFLFVGIWLTVDILADGDFLMKTCGVTALVVGIITFCLLLLKLFSGTQAQDSISPPSSDDEWPSVIG